MENPTLQERFSSALHGSARAWRVNHIILTETGQALYGEVKTVADHFRQNMLKRVDAPTLRLIRTPKKPETQEECEQVELAALE